MSELPRSQLAMMSCAHADGTEQETCPKGGRYFLTNQSGILGTAILLSRGYAVTAYLHSALRTPHSALRTAHSAPTCLRSLSAFFSRPSPTDTREGRHLSR